MFCICKYENFTCSYNYIRLMVYTIHSYLELNSTHIISELPNLINICTFIQMLVVLYLSFVDWRCDGGVFCICKYENFRCSYNYIRLMVYTIHSYLELNSTHIISELSNLICTFVQMLVVLYLSFVDWRCD